MSYQRHVYVSNRLRHEEGRLNPDGSYDHMTTYNVDASLDYVRYIEHMQESLKKDTGIGWRHYCTIPNWVMDRAYREGWYNDMDRLQRWMDAPENRMWKTYKKRLFPARAR